MATKLSDILNKLKAGAELNGNDITLIYGEHILIHSNFKSFEMQGKTISFYN